MALPAVLLQLELRHPLGHVLLHLGGVGVVDHLLEDIIDVDGVARLAAVEDVRERGSLCASLSSSISFTIYSVTCKQTEGLLAFKYKIVTSFWRAT